MQIKIERGDVLTWGGVDSILVKEARRQKIGCFNYRILFVEKVGASVTHLGPDLPLDCPLNAFRRKLGGGGNYVQDEEKIWPQVKEYGWQVGTA